MTDLHNGCVCLPTDFAARRISTAGNPPKSALSVADHAFAVETCAAPRLDRFPALHSGSARLARFRWSDGRGQLRDVMTRHTRSVGVSLYSVD